MAPIGSTGTIDFAWSMVYDADTVCQGFFGDALFVPIDIDNGTSCSNAALPLTDSQWLLQVWNNEMLTGSTVEQRYVAPVGNGGFDLNLSNGASSCAGTVHYSTRLTRQVFLQAGDYTFQVHADDGVRLRVGGVTLIDKFTAPQVADFTATIKAGVDGMYAIEVDHFQQTGGAALTLSWFRQSGGGTPPPAPTGLIASAVDSKTIFLSWNAASGATTYNVKRTIDADPNATFVPIASGVTALNYTDGGLPSGTYYYVVTAVNADGESGPSARAFATLASMPTCSALSLSEPDFAWLLEIFNSETLANAPVETRYDATGDRGFDFSSGAMPPSQCVGQNNYSMRLTRKANFPQGGSYRFTYSVDDGIRIWLDGTSILDLWNQQVLVDQSIVVPVTQGVHDLRVEYKQVDGGAQIKLDWALENGNPTTPLVAPVVTASAGNGQVTLVWNEVPNADIYHVKLQQGLLGFFDIATTGKRTFTYTHTGLTNNTTYTYEVQAENFTTGLGLGPDSLPVSARPMEPAQGDPTLTVEIQALDATPIAPNSTLSLNADGWPSPNPVQVQLLLSCPTNRTTNCFGPVDILIDSPDNKLRVNGATQDPECLPSQNPGSSFQRLHWICPGVIGNITLTPGQTRTIIVVVVVQPSELSTFALTRHECYSWRAVASCNL
ncbi:MAG: PA14 domain-containing protein, partial [Betaproteobacteria bacterium]